MRKLVSIAVVVALLLLPTKSLSQNLLRWHITTTVKDSTGHVVMRDDSVTGNATTALSDHSKAYIQGNGATLWTGLRSTITPVGSAESVTLTNDVSYQWMPDGGEPSMSAIPQNIHVQNVITVAPGTDVPLNGAPAGDRALFVRADLVP